MKRLLFILILTTTFFCNPAIADEGMWLVNLIEKLNIDTMQAKGLELNAQDIYSTTKPSIKDAVVSIDGGMCAGSIISSKGLLLTNHHCAFGDIQSQSTTQNNYLETGFWASNHTEEIPIEGKTVSFLISVKDVTHQIKSQIPVYLEKEANKKDDFWTGLIKEATSDTLFELESENCQIKEAKRQKAITALSKEILKEAVTGTHYDAEVVPMFKSSKFYLFVYETFTDVRLVGTPPSSIGKFGGEPDNWVYPQHTGDFALYRVYSDSTGKPAEYSQNNIAYKPKHYLPISLKGYKNKDFTMILGYPYKTYRHISSFGINTIQALNDILIKVRETKLLLLEEYMSSSEKARMQYADKHFNSTNNYKYFFNQNKRLKNLNVYQKKQVFEKEFIEWSKANKPQYEHVFDSMQTSYTKNKKPRLAYCYLGETFILGPEIFSFASSFIGFYEALRFGSYKKLIDNKKEQVEKYFKNYHAPTDMKVLTAMLDIYSKANIKPNLYPDAFKEVEKKYKGNFERYTEHLFEKSIFADKSKLLNFLDNPELAILQKDPAFIMAKVIIQQHICLEEFGIDNKYLQAIERDSAFIISEDIFEKCAELRSEITDNKYKQQEAERLFMQGLQEMYPDKIFYPDANSTMRLTYGNIADYAYEGKKSKYYTTIEGYIAKEDSSNYEFKIDDKFKQLYENKDFGIYTDPQTNKLHMCFVTNNDISAGNSGSPVLNKRGELIGVVFDINLEGLGGDIIFTEYQRTINLDIRFALWVIDKYAKADYLLEELQIVK